MPTVEESVVPFSNGSQFGDWQESNCASCTKGRLAATSFDQLVCEIDRALAEAYVGEGRIPLAIWDRMGHDDGRYVWPCREHDPPFKNVRPDGSVDPSVKRDK